RGRDDVLHAGKHFKARRGWQASRAGRSPRSARARGLRRYRATLPGRSAGRGLPEEVVDHVDDLAGVDVDQQDIVVIAYPAVGAVDCRQAVLPRVVDPVVAAVEQRADEGADAEPPVRVIPVRRVVGADAEHHAVGIAIVVPVVAAVVAPVAVPPAMVATPAVVVAPVVAPAVIVAAVVAPVAVTIVVPPVVAQVPVVAGPVALPRPVAVAPAPDVACVVAAAVVLRDVGAVAVAVGISAVALDRLRLRGGSHGASLRSRPAIGLRDLSRLRRTLAVGRGRLRAPLGASLAARFLATALAARVGP